METVILVIHLLLAIALVLVILMQRSAQDGGGLMGGSATMGGLFTARGSANLLTRATAILATAFICTSLTLGVMASRRHQETITADEINVATPAAEQKGADQAATTGKGAGKEKAAADKNSEGIKIDSKQEDKQENKRAKAPAVPVAK